MCFGRGRDEDHSPPPAQIPACAANAPGSSLGFWRKRQRVQHLDWRKEAIDDANEALPGEVSLLSYLVCARAGEWVVSQFDHLVRAGEQRWWIAGTEFISEFVI